MPKKVNSRVTTAFEINREEGTAICLICRDVKKKSEKSSTKSIKKNAADADNLSNLTRHLKLHSEDDFKKLTDDMNCSAHRSDRFETAQEEPKREGLMQFFLNNPDVMKICEYDEFNELMQKSGVELPTTEEVIDNLHDLMKETLKKVDSVVLQISFPNLKQHYFRGDLVFVDREFSVSCVTAFFVERDITKKSEVLENCVQEMIDRLSLDKKIKFIETTDPDHPGVKSIAEQLEVEITTPVLNKLEAELNKIVKERLNEFRLQFNTMIEVIQRSKTLREFLEAEIKPFDKTTFVTSLNAIKWCVENASKLLDVQKNFKIKPSKYFDGPDYDSVKNLATKLQPIGEAFDLMLTSEKSAIQEHLEKLGKLFDELDEKDWTDETRLFKGLKEVGKLVQEKFKKNLVIETLAWLDTRRHARESISVSLSSAYSTLVETEEETNGEPPTKKKRPFDEFEDHYNEGLAKVFVNENFSVGLYSQIAKIYRSFGCRESHIPATDASVEDGEPFVKLNSHLIKL